MNNPEISIVVPVFNEETNIVPFLNRTISTINGMDISYEIIFSMDPSTDKTEHLILNAIEVNSNIRLLKFSRRFGQPAASIAGLKNSRGRNVVLIDVDLQDPPELINDMYRMMKDGFDVVYARRTVRHGETVMKKIVAKVGSYLIQKLSDIDIPRNVGEYRMMSRRVVDELINLTESHGYIRGLVGFIGFRQGVVDFERDARFGGEGKYNPFFGSISIGLNGLIGFSSKPLQLMAMLGAIVSIVSFIVGILYVALKILGLTTPGLATIILFVSFFSGVQLLALGLVGEYISRIYDEVKRRPLFIIDKKINFEE